MVLLVADHHCILSTGHHHQIWRQQLVAVPMARTRVLFHSVTLFPCSLDAWLHSLVHVLCILLVDEDEIKENQNDCGPKTILYTLAWWYIYMGIYNIYAYQYKNINIYIKNLRVPPKMSTYIIKRRPLSFSQYIKIT